MECIHLNTHLHSCTQTAVLFFFCIRHVFLHAFVCHIGSGFSKLLLYNLAESQVILEGCKLRNYLGGEGVVIHTNIPI